MRGLDTSYPGGVTRVVGRLQGKWTVQILCAMREHPVRLSQLERGPICQADGQLPTPITRYLEVLAPQGIGAQVPSSALIRK
jgi:DNA-binding HxlR family transcriptional regulator